MFHSTFIKAGQVALPQFTGTRIMMMPIIMGDVDSLPDSLSHYRQAIWKLFQLAPFKTGTAYLTIDEKCVQKGKTHRRAGLHVDGVYRSGAGSWGGGGWGSVKAGMLTVASHTGCVAWDQEMQGWPGPEGDCEHLRGQLREPTLFRGSEVYWLSGLCVHESLPMPADTNRQFVRLSAPSDAPWFEGYTVNPKGVMPTGPILPRREFMDA